jgi:UDP-glucuronate decarboxylase
MIEKISSMEILDEDFKFISKIFKKSKWLRFRKKKILITGASGFMGSYLAQFLCYLDDSLGLELEVICLTRNRKNLITKTWVKKYQQKLRIITEDLNNLKIKKLPAFDLCIFCASNASPIHYKTNPIETIKPNILGLINTLEQASPKSKIIYISSGEVYGNQPNILLKEDNYGSIDPLDTRSCYGESKRMAENICVSYHSQKKIDIKIIRPFHTYGPGLSKNDGRVFADFIHSAANNHSIRLTSDGAARRPFCYIADFISALFFIHFDGKPGNAYNVSNPDQDISIKELAKLVLGIVNKTESSIIFSKQPLNYLKSPITKQMVSVKKLNALGWLPSFDLLDGFTRSIHYQIEKNKEYV